MPGAREIALTIGILLAVTLAGVTLASLRPGGGGAGSVLFRKWLTWSILAPTWAVACLCGALPIATLLTAFALLALREFALLTGLPFQHRWLLGGSAVFSGVLSLWGAPALLAAVPVLLLVGTLQVVLAADVRQGMRHLAFAALAFGYLPLLLDHGVLMVGELSGGSRVLFVTGVAVACSDIGAYIAGRRLGRHPLSPVISPNKTVEGLLGTVVGAAAGFLLFIEVLPPLAAPLLISLPFVVAVGAVWGDLFESVLKREFGTKDAGAWLPGFGGILDRIDSLIVAVPLTYYAMRAAGLLIA